MRFERNPNYWGKQGAEDEVVIQFFKERDTMVQALKNGELDYARGVPADQFDALKADPDITIVDGVANGWTARLQLLRQGNDPKGGGASTKALQDPAFRDALGYAIDKQALIDRVSAATATSADQSRRSRRSWHAEPDDIRAVRHRQAKQKLDAAGYPLDASGKRLDKEGKPISLRLDVAGSRGPKAAEFIVGLVRPARDQGQ